jgi:protein-disulfide isomerase
MERSTLAKWLCGILVAVVLGFLAGRQQQIADNQREILEQIQELKMQSEFKSAQVPSQPSPLEFNLSIEGSASKGDADAKLILIEFSDFECPFCGRHAQESYPRIDRDYVETGKIRYVFRHFPLSSLHPRAMKAAEAGECARMQGRFWPLHDRLFAHQKALDPPSLAEHARAAGLDMNPFESCLEGKAAPAVRADLDAGTRAEISATPTFFLGFAQPDGSVRVVERFVGAKPYAAFQSVLDKLLAATEGGKAAAFH